MIKRLLGLASLLSFFMTAGTMSAQASKIENHILGNPKAPVVIEDYASLTCSHCGDFYTKILPEIQKRYIDTGKVAFIFKDFPLDGVSLRAAALAHCMPADQYHAFISLLYKSIMSWAQQPEKVLVQYAKLGGLTEEKARACMSNEMILDQLITARTDATSAYNINSTPTFILNKGEKKLVGNQSLDEMTRAIDALLAKTKAE